MYILTQNNYPCEANVMVARQQNIVSQSDGQEYTVCLKKACGLVSV